VKLFYRLTMTIAAVTLFVCIITSAYLFRSGNIREINTALTKDMIPELTLLDDMNNEIGIFTLKTLELRMSGSDASQLFQEREKARKDAGAALTLYKIIAGDMDPDAVEFEEKLSANWSAIQETARDLESATAEDHVLQKKIGEQRLGIIYLIRTGIQKELLEIAELTDEIETSVAFDINMIAVTLTLYAAACAAIVLSLYSVSRSVTDLKNDVEKVGAGDLGAKSKLKRADEIGSLASAFNKMIDDLKKTRDALTEKTTKEIEARTILEQKVKELTDTKTAIINMMEDTEELNKKLRMTQKTLKANVEELKFEEVKKNEFMSTAAHELKTPLTSIHGFSQLLQKSEIAKDDEKRGKYLGIIESETIRLSKLVNDVLDISRIDLNTIKLENEEIDIGKMTEEIKTEMDVQTAQKGLISEYIVEKNMPKLYSDRERVQQVLMNLINNSVKYTPKGKITVKVSKENDFVHFMVKDTGVGIAKENQSKIFSRFYQVDSSYTRSGGGVGLGLSLCKELINLMGGKIWFVSEYGKGSEFHFTLPIGSSK